MITADDKAIMIGWLGYVYFQHQYNPSLYPEWASLQTLTFMQVIHNEKKEEVEEMKQHTLQVLREMWKDGLIDFKKENEFNYFKIKTSNEQTKV